MRNVKCSDCEEYKNEWCEKIIDSPHPNLLRDCQYWHERKDMVEVVRCKDCKHWMNEHLCKKLSAYYGSIDTDPDFFCGYAERRL